MKVAKIKKPEVQKLLSQFRKLGFDVNKKFDSIYEVYDPDTGSLVFCAMNGRYDYLCRYDPEIVSADVNK